MKVQKKDGGLCDWDSSKIEAAIQKAAARTTDVVSDVAATGIAYAIRERLVLDHDIHGCVPVDVIHAEVISALRVEYPEVAHAYQTYHEYRKQTVDTFDKVRAQANETIYGGDRENANFDSTLVSTKGSLVRGYLTKELYKQQHLTHLESQGIEDGFIYIHDLRDLLFNGINCCLFDIGNLLKGGFTMAGMHYKEPKSVLSALQVLGDITLVATAQQFGGFTLPELDRVLVPYYKKSLEKYKAEAQQYGIKDVKGYMISKTQEELKQGCQSLEMKVNSVPSSRGDTAFTTISFGCTKDGSNLEKQIQRKIAECFLRTRMNGQGNGSPVVFPKLVYLHDEKQHEHPEQKKLFDLAVQCSAKCMYPDFLSLDAGSVGDAYKRSGEVISPMGCRAFLAPWYEDGKETYVGRANIGAVSLNLPMIVQYAIKHNLNLIQEIDKWLEVIRGFHRRRYAAISETKASTHPLAFTQGGLLNGYRKPDEPIGDIVDAFTASFGITALEEVNYILAGCSMFESNAVHSIVEHIRLKIEKFKHEDKRLYALYGTPAESLCGTQLQQFRKMFGIIPGVSDKEYFSNSFHIHVQEEISPLEKQDAEFELFHKFTGGRIQYVRLDNPKNTKAIETIVKRGMRKGYYQGVNFTLATCEECGHRPKSWTEGDVCICGSHDITVIERTCGYLGVRSTNGKTRFNDAKMAEIKDRKSM